MTDTGDQQSSRGWIRRLSAPKKVAAGVVALAAAIVTVGGAIRAIEEGANWYREWRSEDKPTDLTVTPQTGLQIWQNNVQNDMFGTYGDYDVIVTIPMSSGPFELRTPKQPEGVGIGIAAWTDDSIFGLETGTSTEPTQFNLGKRMATTAFGNATLVLTNEFYNYFVDNAVASHSDSQDKIFFSAIGRTDPFRRFPLTDQSEDLFLVVFIDKNEDEIFDGGELEYMVLDF